MGLSELLCGEVMGNFSNSYLFEYYLLAPAFPSIFINNLIRERKGVHEDDDNT